jgi:hypothetical protein
MKGATDATDTPGNDAPPAAVAVAGESWCFPSVFERGVDDRSPITKHEC